MSFGGRSRKKVKAAKVRSPVRGVRDVGVELTGLAEAEARLGTEEGRKTIQTVGELAAPLRGIRETTLGGIQRGIGTISRTPEEQLQAIERGQNVFFNLQQQIARRQQAEQQAQAQQRFQRTGLGASTVRGAFEAELASRELDRQLQAQSSAIQLQNELARQNLQAQQNQLAQLVGIQQIPTGLASQQLFDVFGLQQQAALANAQLQQQANLANAQIANQPRPSLLGTALSLAPAALGAFGGVGGIARGLGGLGRAFGFGGGGGGQALRVAPQPGFAGGSPARGFAGGSNIPLQFSLGRAIT